MAEQNNIWPKHITVDKRIVKILSSSTYTNFPSAIRELVVNSYDADAENVSVDIDLKKEIITVRDNGKGMSESDFAFYLRIAGKTRKKDEELTKAKRQIVGQFGVGFLSVLPFCEKYLIETKKKGTDEIVEATITSTEYFKNDLSGIDVDEIPIYGSIKRDPKLRNEQYTRIRLVGFSKLTHSFFKGSYTIKNRRNTINNFFPLELFKWELCEYLPITYDNENVVGKKLNSIFKPTSSIPFNVSLNGEKLYRNIHAKNILEFSEEEKRIGGIQFKYAILTDYDPINPTEARHLMLRNLNVGVGQRTTFGLGLEGKVYARLAHLTGEVCILEGLNDLISVSRDKFNFSPDYEKMKDFLRHRLAYWANELDTLSTIEKIVTQLDDKSKVSNIGSLKTDRVSQDLNSLKSKGFEIKSSKENSGNVSVTLNKEKKEVIVSRDITDFNKVINILDKNYKLVLKTWDVNDSEFPAVKFEKEKTLVNESYPLFHNKNQFDTFLKIHILFLSYFENNKINKKVYREFLDDIFKIFNK